MKKRARRPDTPAFKARVALVRWRTDFKLKHNAGAPRAKRRAVAHLRPAAPVARTRDSEAGTTGRCRPDPDSRAAPAAVGKRGCGHAFVFGIGPSLFSKLDSIAAGPHAPACKQLSCARAHRTPCRSALSARPCSRFLARGRTFLLPAFAREELCVDGARGARRMRLSAKRSRAAILRNALKKRHPTLAGCRVA
jgi:hypothetical protein